MASNRLALAALVVACVGAAGVGGYLATKHSRVIDEPAAAAQGGAGTQITNPQALVAQAGTAAAPVVAPDEVRAQASAAPAEAPAARPAGVRPAPVRAPRTEDAPARPAPVEADRAVPASIPPAVTPPQTSVPTLEAQAPQPHVDEPVVEAPRAPEPPAIRFEELVISSDSVIGLQTDAAVTSERAHLEDKVEAHVVRDVRVGGTIAIPAGTRALGTVVVVERGGKFKERARLGIRFHTLMLANGTQLPVSTETIYRFGNAPGNASAARIGGGAVIGAIVGGILGGGKGAAIGATAGAGAGTASVMSDDPNPAVFPTGAEFTARIISPVTVTIEKE